MPRRAAGQGRAAIQDPARPRPRARRRRPAGRATAGRDPDTGHRRLASPPPPPRRAQLPMSLPRRPRWATFQAFHVVQSDTSSRAVAAPRARRPLFCLTFAVQVRYFRGWTERKQENVEPSECQNDPDFDACWSADWDQRASLGRRARGRAPQGGPPAADQHRRRRPARRLRRHASARWTCRGCACPAAASAIPATTSRVEGCPSGDEPTTAIGSSTSAAAASGSGRRYPASLGRREVEALERRRRQEVEGKGVGSADSWAPLLRVIGSNTRST